MSALVDRLARLAADAEPRPLDDLAAHRMVERALLGASLSRPEPRRIARWLFLVPALAAVVIAYLALGPAAEPELSRITLPTGDKLVGAQGARFDITELATTSRRFQLHSGTMLFDVAHGARDQRFEVTTPHAVVVARGTIFSVTTGRATHVHVYEGVVEVSRVRLVAGESWSSDAPALARASKPTDSARIVEAAAEAVHTRAELAAATPVESKPVVTRLDPTSEPPVPEPESPAIAPSAETPKPTKHGDTTASRGKLSLDLLFARARGHIATGDFAEALEVVRDAKTRGAVGGAWQLVEGDALRGLGRASDAADAFESAARGLVGSAAIEPAYTAAYLRFHDLHDGGRAIAALDLADVDREGSPLEERGLALRVRVLDSLGRRDATIEAAKRYLVRFPRGGLRGYMFALVNRRQGAVQKQPDHMR